MQPKKVHSFQSIYRLEELLACPGFKNDLLGGGRFDDADPADIYDGNIMKDFRDKEGKPFFQDKRNLGVALNVDWFNPYENNKYSLGIIYLAIINTSEEHHFKWGNVLIIAIIPRPTLPKLYIN